MESLLFLALLACPVGMGLMMWWMGRGHKQESPVEDGALPDLKAEQARIAAKIDALEQERAAAEPRERTPAGSA